MALVINDRVKETTTTTGTGTVSLGGAVTGFETFAAGVGNSNTTYYCIAHQDQAEFEVGLGTLDGDSSDLTRTTVISSSNSDSAVDFSAGTKDVFCTVPASKLIFEDASNDVTIGRNLTVTGDLTITGDDITMNTNTSGAALIGDGTNFNPVAISGDITIGTTGTAAIGSGVIVNADINSSAAIAMSKTAFTAGTGVSLSTNTLSVDAAQTGITSILATDVKIGEDDQTKIDFETADEIHFYAANAEQVFVSDGVFGPQTDSDVDLGSNSVRWKDAYIDTITSTSTITTGAGIVIADAGNIGSASDTDAIAIASNGQVTLTQTLIGTALDISGDIDVDGTANLDVVDIDGAVDMASTLGVTGVVTANAGVVIDNITIDGTEIDLSSGDLTLDVAGDIVLDADGADIKFSDDGTHYASISNSSSDVLLTSIVSDKDIKFNGNDGGSGITALTLDMSAAGAATFNNDVTAFSDKRLKDNIETIPNALDKVCAMRGVTFTRNDNNDQPGTGVIAQEMQEVFPVVVKENKDDLNTLSVSYGNLVGVLIEAIKELKEEVEKLKKDS